MILSYLGEELGDRTEWVCEVFGLAMHHMVSSEKRQADENNTLPIVRAKIVNQMGGEVQLSRSVYWRVQKSRNFLPLRSSRSTMCWTVRRCSNRRVGRGQSPKNCGV